MQSQAGYVAYQDAPEDARMRLVGTVDEGYGVLFLQRCSKEPWDPVKLAEHALKKVLALVAEAATSPRGAELRRLRKRFFE